MALGLTQPLTEMSTRNISWVGKGGRCLGLTTLPPSGNGRPCVWFRLSVVLVGRYIQLVFTAVFFHILPIQYPAVIDCTNAMFDIVHCQMYIEYIRFFGK